ncbi:MAG: hypothetical protein RL091_3388 [Verrucomicrobiota bacterium]|jgi:hypothetical protein
MRLLCFSDQIETSPSTSRLAMEWAAMTGDSVLLARGEKAGAGIRRAAGEQERHERILPAQPRPDGAANEAGPDTARRRTERMTGATPGAVPDLARRHEEAATP